MDKESPSGGSVPVPQGLVALDRWKQYLVGIAAVLTVAAQLWSAIENQWRLAAITLVLAIVIAALYALSHRVPSGADRRRFEAFRLAMIGLLIAIPLCSLVGLYAYSYLPRALETGTTIAVARFEGAPLPAPYQDCRPSDMLVHTLARVGGRFGGLRVFELPYSIDPDNRWAQQWAQAHGSFEAADVIVYGEYTLFSTGNGNQPDELVINPEVTRVPTIPLSTKSAPLYGWEFPGSVASIRELCGSDLQDAGRAPRFLDDSRRIASAIAGLQALGRQDFEDAQAAVKQAKLAEVDHPQRCIGAVDSGAAKNSLCPGVLAFYLGALDARLGAYGDALQEYAYASGRLGTAAPFINLGELYVRLGQPSKAFAEFDRAVNEDPTSVAAVATRAVYERDYLKPREAALDLNRALQLRSRNLYDELSLSRALYQRGGKGDTKCGIRVLEKVIGSRGFSDRLNVETLVQYGVWLRGVQRPDEAIVQFRRALSIYPGNVEGNYELGLALERSKSGDSTAASSYLRRAEYSPAYTDDDFLERANAAAELMAHFDANSAAKRGDYQLALQSYGASIALNKGAVYAYYDRALLEGSSNKAAAQRDLETAARMRPDDPMIQSKLAQFFGAAGRPDEAQPYHVRAKADIDDRIPKEDQAAWSSKRCRYDPRVSGL